MNEFEFDKIMNEALQVKLPAGLSERLEKALDARASRDARLRRLRRLTPLVGLAASLIICAGIFLSHRRTPQRDTFSDPREAAIAAEQMLTFVSQELNLGLEQVASVNKETMQRIHNVLNEPFNNK
ncbi:MAG: hypothetical protein LBD28_02055 [Tannerellaceae bacterium]|jgi:hypothetical protein|nr:hypothetical protein [Tannerellaceae bacterium]